MEIVKFYTDLGQVNDHKVIVQRKFYLLERTDNAQKTEVSPYCAETIYNSMKSDFCLFDLTLSYSPINNLSVKQGQIFLG